MNHPIWTGTSKKEEKFLRTKTVLVQFSPKGEPILNGKPANRTDIAKLLNNMRRVMKLAEGIGLSANQIGLPYRLFVAEVPGAQGEKKSYAIFNPELEKSGSDEIILEEGCLSVPGYYGEVARASQVILKGRDKQGKPIKIKAWGLLARVFQHEVDHLNGMLFLNKAKNIQQLTPEQHREMKKRREQLITDNR